MAFDDSRHWRQPPKYPITEDEEPARPFHLWNERTNEQVRYRFYADARRAGWAAVKEVADAKVGHTIAVIDVRTGRMLAQFTRKVDNILFREA